METHALKSFVRAEMLLTGGNTMFDVTNLHTVVELWKITAPALLALSDEVGR